MRLPIPVAGFATSGALLTPLGVVPFASSFIAPVSDRGTGGSAAARRRNPSAFLNLEKAAPILAFSLAFVRPLVSGASGDRLSSSALDAIVYGLDGSYEDAEDSSSASLLSFLDDSGDNKPLFVSIASKLSNDPDIVGTLARLVSAYSPPSRPVDVEDVLTVRVVTVRPSGMDIEAVVTPDGGTAADGGGGGGCVAVLVPVTFPEACDESGTRSHGGGRDGFSENDEEDWETVVEGCVMNNLDALEAEATARIEELAGGAAAALSTSTSSYAGGSIDSGAERYLGDEALLDLHASNVRYPEWWVTPAASVAMGGGAAVELADDCDNLRDLLNDDGFVDDLAAVARTGLVDDALRDGAWRGVVLRAVAASVGPAGVVLKAVVAAGSGDHGEDAVRVLEVPVPFREVAPNVSALRAAVLETIAAAAASEARQEEDGSKEARAVEVEAESEDASDMAVVLANVEAETETKAREEAGVKARIEAEEVARKERDVNFAVEVEAEAKAKEEAEIKAGAEAEEDVRENADVKAATEGEGRAKEEEAEVEFENAKTKSKAETKARKEAEAKEARAEATVGVEAENDAKEAELPRPRSLRIVVDDGADPSSTKLVVIADVQSQPQPLEAEAALSARYGSMSDLENRAFAVLLDLGMVSLTPDPDDPGYDPSMDDELAPENVWG